MAKSPDKPSHPSPMHDLELVVCCTLCMHKGLLAALVVPPPPSPPILLANLPEAQQGNTTNIVMKVRLGARRKVRQSILQCRPASSSAWPHLDARLLRRVFSPSSSGKYSPYGLSESLPLPMSTISSWSSPLAFRRSGPLWPSRLVATRDP